MLKTTLKVFLQASCWILILVAIPVGVVGSAVVLFSVVGVTGSRIGAAIVGMIALILCTGGLSWWAAKGITRSHRLRHWLSGTITSISFALAVLVTGFLVFAPAPNYIPPTVTDDTQYWDLSTGSQIAFSLELAVGVRQSTPVILVHGGPGAPDNGQKHLMAVLAEEGFDVYTYDQIGAGLSGRLEDVSDYTVARQVADLEAIRSTIGAEQIVLIGASWGGQLIANYLAEFPEHVAKAIISSPGNIWSPAFTNKKGLTATGIKDQDEVIKDYPRFMLAHVLLEAVGPKTAHALLPDRAMDGVFQAIVDRFDMSSGCQNIDRLPGSESGIHQQGVGFWVNAMTSRNSNQVADPRPALRNVSTPMLVLRSECDYIAWEVTREYRDLLPNAVLIAVEDAGHTISAHQPELYLQAVRSFLLDAPLPLENYTATFAPW
jgi:proline iminopeptidase